MTLHGNFTLYLFDMKFQVRSGDEAPVVYNASMGGARGDEVPSPVHEYNNTLAELRFTNATFTFLPAGRPLQINLKSAATNVTGAVYLSDVKGSLRHGGVDVDLDASFVELDAEDLRLGVEPVDGTPMRYGLDFSGLLAAATVDGQRIDLAGAGSESPDGEHDVAGLTVAPTNSDTAWWPWLLLALILAVAAVGAKAGVESRRARRDPDEVTERGEAALDRGYYRRARSHARRVLRHHHNHHDAVALHAMTFVNRQENDKVISFLRPYVLGPADEGGVLSLVYCMALRKERGVEKARRFLEKAVEVYPAMADVMGEYPDLARDFGASATPGEDASYS